jgi:zinc-ribbon domain
MARFCTQCGTPAASDEVKFCSKCGAALPAPAAAAAPTHAPAAPAPPAATPPAAAAAPSAAAPVQAAPVAAKSSGTFVKVLVAVVGFFVLVGVLGVATCAYIGYKAKQKFEQAKTEYGLGNTGPAAQERDVCSLVTKEEVTQFTGVTITSVTGSTSKCTYSSASNPVVLETDVSWQGGALGLKLGIASLKAMGGADTVIQVPGIGDEAYTIGLKGKTAEDMQHEAETDQSGTVKGMTHFMAMAPLMFRQGDVMMTIRLTQAADPDAAKQSIAKAAASRL